jgi:hypothetical protein
MESAQPECGEAVANHTSFPSGLQASLSRLMLNFESTVSLPVRSTISMTFEVLHYQKIHAVLVADVMKRADACLVQRRNGVRLAIEAFLQFGACGKMRRQNFGGHVAPEARIPGAIHFTHATGQGAR